MTSRTVLTVVGGMLSLALIAMLGLLSLTHLVGNGLALSSDAIPSGKLPRPSTNLTSEAADPGSPRPFGSEWLLQTDDFVRVGLDLSATRLDDDGSQPLTACTGKLTMSGLTADGTADQFYVDGSWHSRHTTDIDADRARLTESISRAISERAARRFVALMVSELTGCSYRDDGVERRLSDPIPVRADAGTAVRFVAYDADGRIVGGVGVFRRGRDFGVYELTGGSVDLMKVLDVLTRRAVARCG